MKPFSLLVKPASADCNLSCNYCFYLEKKSIYPNSPLHRMNDEVLEKMISSYMALSMPQYVFGWQGGEPTLMGADFFRKVTDFQKKYGKDGASVSNGLQTNGTLLDDEMAGHFRKYNFLLGVSLDGPEEIHDMYRKDASGRGSFSRVMNGVEILKKHSVAFNILSLVSAANVKRVSEIYSFYARNAFRYLQFIPCVEFNPDNSKAGFAITGKEWGEFLCALFDLWHPADTRKVSIRLFDSIINLLLLKQRNICHFGTNCCQYFVVEHNGDVYPCDFFVTEKLKLGNILENSWEEMLVSDVYKNFGKQKSMRQHKCGKCQFLDICQGDCLKHRIYGNMRNPSSLSWLCEGWEIFFRHSIRKFRKTVEKLREEKNVGASKKA